MYFTLLRTVHTKNIDFQNGLSSNSYLFDTNKKEKTGNKHKVFLIDYRSNYNI